MSLFSIFILAVSGKISCFLYFLLEQSKKRKSFKLLCAKESFFFKKCIKEIKQPQNYMKKIKSSIAASAVKIN